MTTLRVLIVEDEPLIAMELEDTITAIMRAVVIIRSSVAGAKEVLCDPVDFAFLDVDVTNGKTYEIAHLLGEKKIPFVFISASSQGDLPALLRTVRDVPRREDVGTLGAGRASPRPSSALHPQGTFSREREKGAHDATHLLLRVP